MSFLLIDKQNFSASARVNKKLRTPAPLETFFIQRRAAAAERAHFTLLKYFKYSCKSCVCHH